MGKAIEGAAMLAGAVGMGVAAYLDPALLASPLFDKAWTALIMGGISMEAGAIASALTNNAAMSSTMHQAAAPRQVIYGQRRVKGVVVYESTTGSKHDQVNMVIAIAGHVCDSITGLYLDGRKVFWQVGSGGNTTRNGVNFGGSADGTTRVGPGGQNYNFGTLVYCEARYGDQLDGDVILGLTANDPAWVADGHGNSPWMGGCTYVYLKMEYDTSMFPNGPLSVDIDFVVNGKNDILDPRTSTTGFTNNWALCVADKITDTVFGLGDTTGVNVDQLIAAANVCDEQIALGIGGTESQYTLNWMHNSDTSPGSALDTMMTGAGGRLSYIGGEWFIWPAYWQGPSFTFDENALTGSLNWKPNRSARDLVNRVNGTYIAANYPYNTAGNLYDSNGWFDGTIANTYPFGWQPTNYPQYAADVRHGYAADEYLTQDGGIERPLELAFPTVVSITQGQRLAKIALMRNRLQGSGSAEMNMAAWGMQPLDVMQFSFPALGWSEKYLEIAGDPAVQFAILAGDSGSAPSIRPHFSFQETAASVYEWSTSEELTAYDVPSNPAGAPWTPAPPTGMTLTSSAATALIGLDGVVQPRVEVQWDTPQDILTKQIQVQYASVTAENYLLWSSDVSNAGWIKDANPNTDAAPSFLSYEDPPPGLTGQSASMSFPAVPNTADDYTEILQSVAWGGPLTGVTLTFSVWIYANTADSVSIYLVDNPFTEGQINNSVPLAAGWNRLTATRTFTGTGTSALCGIRRIEGQPAIGFAIYCPMLQKGAIPSGQPVLTAAASGTATGSWISFALVDVSLNACFVGGLVAGGAYSFRIRSIRANGAYSVWVEEDGYVVSTTLSVVAQLALASGSLTSFAYSDGTADILVSPFTALFGMVSTSVLPAGAFDITGLNQGQLYWVYYVDPAFSGGAVTPVATQNQSDFLNKVGYFLIDSIVTQVYSAGGGVGLRYSPSAFMDSGAVSTTTPAAAYDNDVSTAAVINGTARLRPGPGGVGVTQYLKGECAWSGFSSYVLTAAANLNVTCSLALTGPSLTVELHAVVGGTDTTMQTFDSATTPTVAQTTYTLSLPIGTDLSTVSFYGFANPVSHGDSAALSIAEIYIQ